MKRLYIPILFSKEFTAVRDGGATIFHPELEAFTTMDKAQEKAQALALTDPKSKVVIFEALSVVEPRRIEFATKKYTEGGELLA